MRIPIKRASNLLYLLLLAAALCFMAYVSSQDRLNAFGNTGTVRPISNVAYTTGAGEGGSLGLPAKLKGLAPRTTVTLSAEVESSPRESLLIKSVFTPMRVHLDDTPVYECGQEGSFPSYMNDPPTILSVIPLPEEGGTVSLRVEYLSLTQRDALSLPIMYTGEETGLLTRQFYADGFSFLFSLLLIFMGLVMAAVSLRLVVRLSSGSSFLWLGLFSLTAGIWGLGECDLTAFLLPWPSLLYAMAYLGLFTMTIPFLRFGLMMLQPKNKLPLQIMLGVHYISVAGALVLQLSGAVDFTKSLYWFHIIAPLGFVTFAACLLWEHFRHHNPATKRFGTAILLLASAVVLELANYWLHFTGALTLFFQLGVLAFVIALGIVSGYYVRDSLRTAAEKARLEYEMAAVNRQLELQRIQYRKLAENDEAIKAQRHDLRHQLAVLRELNAQGNTEKLGGYLDTLFKRIPTGKGVLLCENYAVNAVAVYYHSMAQDKGINISIQLTVPPELGSAQESDLCIIVGNLLENAMEACVRMEKGQRFIRMNSRLQHGVLTVTLDNSFDGNLREKDGVFLSSKREGEGTGLFSMKAVAEKYGGATRFEVRDGVFQSSVYLRLKQDDG